MWAYIMITFIVTLSLRDSLLLNSFFFDDEDDVDIEEWEQAGERCGEGVIRCKIIMFK